jgi:hypothetical protein
VIVAGFWLGAVVPGILAVVPIFRKSRRPITKAARCPDPISKNGNSTPIGRSSSRTSCWEPASGFVIHHTNCGMELFTDDVIGDFLADSLETAKFDGKALVESEARSWSERRPIHKMAHHQGSSFKCGSRCTPHP